MLGARINHGGNFCGHDPEFPKFELARPANKGKGGLPPIITTLMARLPQFFFMPESILPLRDVNKNTERGGRERSERQLRSEAREACTVVLAAILKRTDLFSLRVGIPKDDGFHCLALSVIINDTGLARRRVERAVNYLSRANLIESVQPRKLRTDGKGKLVYSGLPAIRTVSKHLFTLFGLDKALKIEQGKATGRLKEKAAQTGKSIKQLASFALIVSTMAKSKSKKAKTLFPDEGYMRAFNQRAAELLAQGLSAGAARAQAELELKPKFSVFA